VGRGPCAFTESDVRRAVKAIIATGQPVSGVRFHTDGGFTVVVGKPGKAGEVDNGNEWDAKYGEDRA
jgi:hypothetical protein